MLPNSSAVILPQVVSMVAVKVLPLASDRSGVPGSFFGADSALGTAWQPASTFGVAVGVAEVVASVAGVVALDDEEDDEASAGASD